MPSSPHSFISYHSSPISSSHLVVACPPPFYFLVLPVFLFRCFPFVSFTPIFLLFTSPLLTEDVTDTQDLAGILCIVAGAYLLQIRSTYQGWLAPFRAMISQPGPRRMLSVALIYSITSNFDKIGVLHSSPIFWSLSISSLMAVGFLLMLRFLPHPTIPTPSTNTLGILLAIGLLQTVGLFFHNTALSLGPVPSVIAVKRSSILFATLWGIMFLREERGKERLAGAVLMVIGIGILGI